MEIISRRKALEECGPPNAISLKEIDCILREITARKNDIFYDLGSGHGRFVRTVVKKTPVKRANGIEFDVIRFCESIRLTKKMPKKFLKRINFWYGKYDENFDFSDATIIYQGHEEDIEEIPLYKQVLKNKRTKIIKMDLPFISYRPIKIIDCKSRRFFVMQYPLQKYRIWNKNKWASCIDVKFTTIDDVWKYYRKVLEDYNNDEKSIKESMQNMNRLSKRFRD